MRLATAAVLACVGCAGARTVNVAGGLGVYMAYEVAGRVTTDANGCAIAINEASVALFSASGTLLDEARTDGSGKFVLGVRDPDVADSFAQKLDQDDPTVQVTLRVQTNSGQEQRFALRLPRPVHGREYRVRFDARRDCDPIL